MIPEETALILAQLYTVWPQQGTEDDAMQELRLWTWAFQHDEFATVQVGVNMWVKGGKPFMPKPSDIREMVAKRILNLDPDTEWGKVRKQIQKVGYPRRKRLEYREATDDYIETDPEVFHPLVERVIDNLGWKDLCYGDPTEGRKAFIFGLRNLLKLEQDNIVFGTAPLALPESTMEALTDGDHE